MPKASQPHPICLQGTPSRPSPLMVVLLRVVLHLHLPCFPGDPRFQIATSPTGAPRGPRQSRSRSPPHRAHSCPGLLLVKVATTHLLAQASDPSCCLTPPHQTMICLFCPQTASHLVLRSPSPQDRPPSLARLPIMDSTSSPSIWQPEGVFQRAALYCPLLFKIFPGLLATPGTGAKPSTGTSSFHNTGS